MSTAEQSSYDAIVVGASVAGSTAATLLARQGLRVALVEKSPNADQFKRICTHEIVPRGKPALQRLGVLAQLEALAGPAGPPRIWTEYGWIDPPMTAEEAPVNVRREVLDPLLRQVAADTEGVDLRLGETVTGMSYAADGRVDGVVLRGAGGEATLTARLVVAADGADSTVGKLTGVEPTLGDHARIGYAGYFRGVERTMPDGSRAARMWLLGPDVAYTFPTDGDLTLLALAPLKTPERVAAFKADPDREFRRAFAALPDGPDLTDAELDGRYLGKLASVNARRRVAAPGLAFVGDAAQVTDFVWGTGCGFALASAEMLADAAGPALAKGAPDADVDRGLRRYQRQHRRAFAGHHAMTSDYSTGRPFNAVERALFSAGTRDRRVARAVGELGGRERSPLRVVNPAVLSRAVVVSAVARRAA